MIDDKMSRNWYPFFFYSIHSRNKFKYDHAVQVLYLNFNRYDFFIKRSSSREPNWLSRKRQLFYSYTEQLCTLCTHYDVAGEPVSPWCILFSLLKAPPPILDLNVEDSRHCQLRERIRIVWYCRTFLEICNIWVRISVSIFCYFFIYLIFRFNFSKFLYEFVFIRFRVNISCLFYSVVWWKVLVEVLKFRVLFILKIVWIWIHNDGWQIIITARCHAFQP